MLQIFSNLNFQEVLFASLIKSLKICNINIVLLPNSNQ